MIALIIIAAVILLIIIIVNIPVNAFISFYDGNFDLTVKFAGITLYPKKDKQERSPPDEDKSDSAENSGDTETDNSESNADESLTEKEDDTAPKKKKKSAGKGNPLERLNNLLDELEKKKNAVQLLAELATQPLKKLGGKLRIDNIKLHFAAADDDAYEAAMLYGKLNAAVYNAIAALRCFISISLVSVKIDCLFNTPKEQSRYDGECVVRLRPASVLNAVTAIIFRYAVNMKKYSPILVLLDKKGKNKPKNKTD